MLRRCPVVLPVCLLILIFSDLARASVSDTTWDIRGTLRIRVSISGLGSHAGTIDFSDEVSFHADGSFEMTGLDGVWKQVRNKITVTLDPAEIESFLEDFLKTNGLDVTINITKLNLTGTEQRNGTINGRIILNMDIRPNGLGLEGKLNVSATFSGTKITGTETQPKTESSSLPPSKSLIEIIGETLYNANKTTE